jgi:hypothetical protein
LENWSDLLAFVSRPQLVALSNQIWHRQFAKILQFFLHECGEISLGGMTIVGPEKGKSDGDGRPMVRKQHKINSMEIG